MLDEVPPLRVPGNFPYREGMAEEATSPVMREQCTMCGECVTVCPTAAITVGDHTAIDRSLCILCSACVRSCPTGAMVWEDRSGRSGSASACWLLVYYRDGDSKAETPVVSIRHAGNVSVRDYAECRFSDARAGTVSGANPEQSRERVREVGFGRRQRGLARAAVRDRVRASR